MATKIGEQLQSVFLKCTSAFTLDGAIIKAGQIVEMLEDDAKSLLARGKAELATIEGKFGFNDDAGTDSQDGPADPAPVDTPADPAPPAAPQA